MTEPRRVARTGKTAPAVDAAPDVAPDVAPAVAPAGPAAVAVGAAHRHPSLGLAPASMTAGFPQAAERLRRDAPAIAARALESALANDRRMRPRYDEVGLRRLLHDAEMLVERLAMCVASDDPRWLAEYAEWIAPIYRRRRVSLLDVAALCDGIRGTLDSTLDPVALPAADRALTAATEALRRSARLAGDTHKRNALWKWLYRGV